MKTKTITYNYDPDGRSLTILIDGKPRGGFMGPEAEKRFVELLDQDETINIVTMNADDLKKTLIRRFHAALATQGIMEHKESIISPYGVESTTELTIDQLKELVASYSLDTRQQRANAPADIRTLRSDILTTLNKMGIYVVNNDWSSVNNYMMDKRIAGKMLWQLNKEELLALRKKLHSIFSKLMDASTDIERQQLLN